MTRPLEAVQEDQIVEYQEDDQDLGNKFLDELHDLQDDDDLNGPIIEEDEVEEVDQEEDENALPTFEQQYQDMIKNQLG